MGKGSWRMHKAASLGIVKEKQMQPLVAALSTLSVLKTSINKAAKILTD